MAFILREGSHTEGSDDTPVRCKRLPGRAKSLVRVMLAVDPSWPADQGFNIDGHACQVYRVTDHARMAVALVPGDSESWPADPNALVVQRGAGVEPAEAGTFPSLDLSGMELTLVVDGTSYTGTLSEAVLEDVVAPVGPGLRQQHGPDLLRRKHYLLRCQLEGSDGTNEPLHYVTVADVHVTTRVDMDLAEVIVHWQNGAWRCSNNPYQTNPSSNGPVWFDELKIPTASLPGGYSVALFAPHPYQGVEGGDVKLIKAMPSGQVHMIPSASQTVVRFAVFNSATVSALDARNVLRLWDRGQACTGPLSYHFRHAFGPRLDILWDPQRWGKSPTGEYVGWRSPAPGQSQLETWRALDAHADAALNDARIAWELGNGHAALASLPAGVRRGWHYGLWDDSTGGAGGAGIYGMSTPFQARAGFELTLLQLDAAVNRCPLSQVDLDTGRNANPTDLAAANSSSWQALNGGYPGAVGRLPYQVTASLRPYSYIHPHLVPGYVDMQNWVGTIPNQPEPGQFKLAPSGRPWSDPPAGKTCPYRDAIDWHLGGNNRWSAWDLAHASRAMGQIHDGIWHLDDPVAHRLLEQYAVSRAMWSYAHLPVSKPYDNFATSAWNLRHIIDGNNRPPKWGSWRTQFGINTNTNQRDIAWALMLAVSWWHVSDAAERARIAPWFAVWTQWVDLTFQESGFALRHDSNNSTPDPYNPNACLALTPTNECAFYLGPTNMAQRSGAFPHLANSGWSHQPTYMSGFMAAAFYALKHGPNRDALPHVKSAADSTIRVASTLRAVARHCYPQAQSGNFFAPGYFILLSNGLDGHESPPLSTQDHLNGASRWIFGPNAAQRIDMRNFQGWFSLYGYRDTGDLAMLDLLAGDFAQPPGNTLALGNAMRSGIQARWASSAFRQWPADDHTYWLGVLAELDNLRDQITT